MKHCSGLCCTGFGIKLDRIIISVGKCCSNSLCYASDENFFRLSSVLLKNELWLNELMVLISDKTQLQILDTVGVRIKLE